MSPSSSSSSSSSSFSDDHHLDSDNPATEASFSAVPFRDIDYNTFPIELSTEAAGERYEEDHDPQSPPPQQHRTENLRILVLWMIALPLLLCALYICIEFIRNHRTPVDYPLAEPGHR
ncbi:hypothetical protein B0T22DRAFT_481297 [Podospora appendiculata]|uniref:Uncharacterized protein n=1 Tax=Podospora appendiculata TaxID=314037 RepID=A0AAE0XCK7_9PEZI|nr:hypothetical protein B0T22DRAFT_481297 [Podospora appendiculata]